MRAAALLVAGCLPASLDEVVVDTSRVVPTTVEMSWFTAASGTSWVELVDADGERRRSATTPTGTEHVVRVAALQPGSTYGWRAYTDIGGQVLRSREQVLETAPLPSGFPAVELALSEAENTVQTGHVLTSIIERDERVGGGWVVLLDPDGEVVWWFDTGHAGAVPADLQGRVPASWSGRSLPLSSHYDADLQTLTFAAYDLDQQLLLGVARHLPLDAMDPEEVVLTRLPDGHHDFAMVDGGDTVAYLGYQTATIDGDRWAADAVLEIPTGTPDQRNIRRVWSWLEDGPGQPEVTLPVQETFSYGIAELEWTHSNSLMASGDAYFVMAKFLDCIVKIDQRSGRTQWVMGGPFSDFTLEDGSPVWGGHERSELWSQAHMSDLWYDPANGIGGFTVFDNGSYRATEVNGRSSWSRLVEYTFDERARTVREAWSYVPPEGLYTTLLGDLDRIGDDRWLASWSNLSARGLEEVDRTGQPLWRAVLATDGPSLFGRAQFIPSPEDP